MTELGEYLIQALEAELSQPTPSNSPEFAATKKSWDSALRADLVEYFSNIINLPYKSREYDFFKNVTHTNYSENNPEARPWEYLGAPIEYVSDEFKSRTRADVFSKDFEIPTHDVLDTQEKWESFVNKNLDRIENDRKKVSDQRFNDFIDECLKPKNYRELLGIIQLIELIAHTNRIGIQKISAWVINDENDAMVGALGREIEKNSDKQITAVNFFKAITSLEKDPDSLERVLDIAQNVEDYVISKHDEESFKKSPFIKESAEPFLSFLLLIPEIFAYEVSRTKAKDSPFIQSFLKQLPESYNIDIARDFFAVSRETLLKSDAHPKKPSLH